jgi:hypothetical protein
VELIVKVVVPLGTLVELIVKVLEPLGTLVKPK